MEQDIEELLKQESDPKELLLRNIIDDCDDKIEALKREIEDVLETKKAAINLREIYRKDIDKNSKN